MGVVFQICWHVTPPFENSAYVFENERIKLDPKAKYLLAMVKKQKDTDSMSLSEERLSSFEMSSSMR